MSRETVSGIHDIIKAVRDEAKAVQAEVDVWDSSIVQLLDHGPGFMKLGLALDRRQVEDLKRRLRAKYETPPGIKIYLAHRDEFKVKPPHPVDYPPLIKPPRTPGGKAIKYPTYHTIKIRSPKFGSEDFGGPIRYTGPGTKTDRQRLVDGLTGKDGYPHRPNCECWYCGLFLNGPWHEHEAESRVDYGAAACRAMGYGLWTWHQRAMTDSDRDQDRDHAA